MTTLTLRPIGAGSETALDWEFPTSAAHYTLVDDVTPDHSIGTQDEPDKAGSTAVQNKNGSAGSYQRDLYDLPPHEVGIGIIDQIEVFVVTLHNVSQAQASIRIGGITDDSADIGSGNTWGEVSNVWTTNPATSNAWLWSEIDLLEIGVRLKGSTATPDWAACTQVYVVITYAKIPVVLTHPASAFGATSVTGHGTIVNIGQSSVTEHGMAWNTSKDPTISGGGNFGAVSTEGAGSAGAFSSFVTGLLEGRTYFMRAYATNNDGTGYGNNIKFTSGFSWTQSSPGNISVKGDRLHWITENGLEVWVEGTPVGE